MYKLLIDLFYRPITEENLTRKNIWNLLKVVIKHALGVGREILKLPAHIVDGILAVALFL